MSKPLPGPDLILRELERLRSFVSDVAARETRQTEGERERERLAQRRVEAARKSSQEQLQTAISSANARFVEAMALAEGHSRDRAISIRRAQVNVRKSAAQRAEAEEGRRKFELQREMLRATRERDAGLAAAKSVHDSFVASFDSAQSHLTAHELDAQRLLGVHGRTVLRDLATAHERAHPDVSCPESALATELVAGLESLASELAAFRRQPLPALSRAWPVTLLVVLSPAAIVPILQHLRINAPSAAQLLGLATGLGALALLLHAVGHHQARPGIHRILDGIGNLRVLLRAGRDKSAATHASESARIEAAYEVVSTRCNQAWNDLATWLESNRGASPAAVDARATHALARNEALLKSRLQSLRERRDQFQARLENEARQRLANAEAELVRSRESALVSKTEAGAEILSLWERDALPILEILDALRHSPAAATPAPLPNHEHPWSPPSQFTPTLRFGTVEARLDPLFRSLPATLTDSPATRGPWHLPLLLRFPAEGSLLIEADAPQRPQAISTLNHVICRLLAGAPPGRIAFTVFDPVGLGQSFAGLTHLSDEAEHLINGRIWTQSAQLEDRLTELNDHLEKVIQMYLRNEYATIGEYNEQAGNIAEKYRFLVLADFPSGFSDLALRRLASIASTGARCGVFLLVHWNPRLPLPQDFPAASFRQSGLHLVLANPGDAPPLRINGRSVPDTRIELDSAPDTETVTGFIHQIARANRDSNRIEVPFDHIAPPAGEIWSGDTASELRVPIGRTGATKLQYLALGKATRQHALIAGKTGSGKSTLFHVLITNLALWCRPNQIEFYLVDFKKGVEFKCYATHRLPHARVVAIESDRDFGLSVLQRLDEELRRRGELFRAANVQDIASYRRTPSALPMPRVLLLVDEFQEFFVEEDRIAQNASALLDRIVRQGRAFGVHVVLGSQTLGGAYTVARSTLGQMVVRIALQCNEADALLIMDEDNPAPRLLSRPGEAIYNDDAGARSGNSPFQVVWLSDEVRDNHLRQIRERADALAPASPSPLIFEGDAPADVRENPLLRQTLAAASTTFPTAPRTWLGAPNSIKGPTEVAFTRRSADNLLLVGQRSDAMLAITGVALAALAAQFPAGSVAFTILDGSPPDAPDHAFLARVAGSLSQPASVARAPEAPAAIRQLSEDLRTRTAGDSSANTSARFLIVHGLEGLRALRQEDEFSFAAADSPPHPGAMLKELLSEGPAHGIHVLLSCDTWGNVNRFLGRKGLAEFGYRVLFQMSANDSASLIDNPAASRLGMHRALLYQDREGHLEIFRPYALPDPAFLRA